MLDNLSLLGMAPSADYALVWQAEPERLYAIGRALTALAGVATVGVVLWSSWRALGPPAALIFAATRMISRASRPPGSVAVTPGAEDESMTLKLKLRYCASVSSHTLLTTSSMTVSTPRSRTSNMG